MRKKIYFILFVGLFFWSSTGFQADNLLHSKSSKPDQAQGTIQGCPLLPANNIWNTAIDTMPLDSYSAQYITTIGAAKGMHADFGSGLWDGGPIGIPYTTVPGSQEKVTVTFDYEDESDPGPYPVPPDAPIEGGSDSDGDRHVLVVDRDNCILFELYYAYPQPDGSWTAGSGAIYDLKSHALRPAGWTSADAAGLPILPGLVRFEEVAAGEIKHAVRFTAPQTQRKYIWPARHFASSLTGSQYPPMGQRFRLKANFNISGFSPQVQVILKALKKYGMILADNGASWYISGVPDERWNNDVLHELANVKGSNFEAVDVSSLMISPHSGEAKQNTSSNTITVISPNGGEKWVVGSSHNITWSSTGTVGNVKIAYSVNNGGSWSNLVSSTANDGVYAWTVPAVPSSNCKVRVSETDGSPSDTGNAVFSIVSNAASPVITLNRSQLNFGAVLPGVSTGPQTFWISNGGQGTLNWSLGSNAGWLQAVPASGTKSGIVTVSVDHSGLSVGTYTGTVTITDPLASNSPQTVTVYLTVKSSSQDQPPFGSFDTPIDGSTVSGSIPVTGWALDDQQVEGVKIYRREGSQLVYIGDAVFIEGARPDIETANPGYPLNYKAGWGYMMLTNFLPNGGNGTFVLQVEAADVSGHQVTLGTKTITCDNAHAVKPFGAIDTPAQGGTASGSRYVNWGWVLTPQPNMIPTDGSSIDVWVDGVRRGHPSYNIYRSDVAALFPGYANSSGPAGSFIFNTTALSNGIHTIFWTATDTGGNIDGIGSRYFTIQNLNGTSEIQNYKLQNTNYKQITNHKLQTTNKAASFGQDLKTPAAINVETQDIASLQTLQTPATGHCPPTTGCLFFQRGYNPESELETLYPDENGRFAVEIKELERLVIYLGDRETEGDRIGNSQKDIHSTLNTQHLTLKNTPSTYYDGFLINGSRLEPLPIGSTFDGKRGVFYWQPGPGFLGDYRLVFFSEKKAGFFTKTIICITIKPKS